MQAAFENGINFFDTAEVYAEGRSELVLGNIIKRAGWKRSDLVIATKLFWGGAGPNDRGLSRKHLVEGIKASLKRLQMDYVDLIFAHRPDPKTPMEEIVRGFNWMIDQGLAFYWGTSEWSAEQISDAWAIADRLGLVGPAMEQPQYNMFCRERVEKEYAPLYEKRGLGTTIWSPLAGGLLTGKYNNGIPEGSRLSLQGNAIMKRQRDALDTPEGREKIAKVKDLSLIATELGCSVSQLALAWCLKNPRVSTVITGASKVEQLVENVKAFAVAQKLDQATMKRIEDILKNRPEMDVDYRGS